MIGFIIPVLFIMFGLLEPVYTQSEFESLDTGAYFLGTYKTSRGMKTWMEVREDCRNHWADLVTVDSEEELSSLLSLIKSMRFKNGTSFSTSGVHIYERLTWWSNGKDVTFLKRKPDYKPTKVIYYLSLVLYNNELYMIDTNGEDEFYICEFVPGWVRAYRLILNYPYVPFSVLVILIVIRLYLNTLFNFERRQYVSDDQESLIGVDKRGKGRATALS
ncbi:uncharacterized protein LOC115626233 [Scaptodrosophila lebanonensis]|uniref:Uncharacterized protein LOC115626233 n=1 Tax=Drosophila lebanonensis TaxID=7225 RepID=A0A6J2TLD4_DROLE|nr:uncharacterized protein LOC115626233 [Scaptodrosophila lebanonensis]